MEAECRKRELTSPDSQAHRRAVIDANVNEIFAIRSELGIHQDSSTPSSATHAVDSANSPVADPFDEAILCHLGVGEAREKKEMLPTTENLLRVEAKRKWVRSRVGESYERNLTRLFGCSSRRKRTTGTRSSRRPTTSSTLSGPCSASQIKRWRTL